MTPSSSLFRLISCTTVALHPSSHLYERVNEMTSGIKPCMYLKEEMINFGNRTAP